MQVLIGFYRRLLKTIADYGAMAYLFKIPHLGVDDVGPSLLPKPFKKPATNGLHRASARAGFPRRYALSVFVVGNIAACRIAIANYILIRIQPIDRYIGNKAAGAVRDL